MISKKYYGVVITLICLLFGTMQANAQGGSIVRGKVILKQTGAALPGVTVIEKNRDNRILNGVLTDVNGNYQLKIANKADSLYFSQIGMKSIARAIAGRELINITMSEDVTELEEVAIVAKRPITSGGFMGIAQRDQTASVATLEMKNLEEIPATSLDQILEGQVSGLMVSMNSGDPGSGSSIQIRGATSLGLGSKPLIVVDDVPIKTNEVVDVNNPNGLSELVNISPTDIATIEVLKDAAATALYGSDGANGVIVIKTKRGDKIKPRVNITSMLTVKLLQQPLPLRNGEQDKTMILEAYQNRLGPGIDLTQSPIRNLYLEKGAYDYENYNNNTYWPGEVNMKSGLAQNYTGSIIGGGESAQYLISLGYLNEVGPVIGTKLNRVSGRFNFDYRISNKLTFNSDISYVSTNKTNSYDNIGDIALKKAPVLPIYVQDTYGNSLPSYFFPGTTGFQNDIKNPIALAKKAMADNGSDRLDAKVLVRYNPLKGLQINSLISTTYESITDDRFLPHSATGADYYKQNYYFLIVNSLVNTAAVNPKNAFSLYFKNDLIYKFNIKKHTMMAGLFTVYQDNSTNYLKLAGTNTPSEDLTAPYLTDIQTTISSGKTLERDFSVVGQLYYLYGDRYAINGSVRRQGNSAFGKNNRYGTFPAISGFWRPISEPFLKDKLSNIFDEFKIRGSYGLTGRAPKVSAANAFTFSANAPFVDMIGVTSDNIQLVNLKWEKTTSSNVGCDISLLKGRLSMIGDLSFMTTRDLILDVPISNSSGFETMTRNFGTIKGKVLEGALTGVPVASKKWNMTVSFNISGSKSKVIELPDNLPVIRGNVLDNGKFLSLVNVGDQVGTIYGLKYQGVYSYDGDAYAKNSQGQFITNLNGEKVPIRWMKQDGEAFTGGDAIYADLNKDGIINKQDVTAIGNTNPQFYGGFMFRLTYNRAWEIFANFTYQYGFDIINLAKMNTTNMYYNNNQTQAVMRRWRKQGDVTDMPRALNGVGHNWVGSDRYVEDGSYIKFGNLSLAYNLQKEMLNKLRLRSAKVAFTVTNLGILTKYSGVDPSISGNRNDPFSLSQDNALTPSPITYTLGIWLNI